MMLRDDREPAGGTARGSTDRVQGELKAYVDGELSALRRLRVRQHLSRCAGCRREVAWLERTGREMHELDTARPRPELRARILASLPQTPPQSVYGPARPSTGRRLALAGSFCAVACVAVAALHYGRSGVPAAHVGITPRPVVTASATGASRGAGVAAPHNVSAPAHTSGALQQHTPPVTEDETSREADHLTQEAEKQERLALARLAAPASHMPETHTSKGVTAEQSVVRFAMTVQDPAGYRQTLAAWVEQNGGRVATTPSSAPQKNAGNSAPRRDPFSPPSSRALLVCSVPTVKVAGFEHGLELAGAVNMTPIYPAPASGDGNSKQQLVRPKARRGDDGTPDRNSQLPTPASVAPGGPARTAGSRPALPAPAFTRLIVELRASPPSASK